MTKNSKNTIHFKNVRNDLAPNTLLAMGRFLNVLRYIGKDAATKNLLYKGEGISIDF